LFDEKIIQKIKEYNLEKSDEKILGILELLFNKE
jgi:hypothetical protein